VSPAAPKKSPTAPNPPVAFRFGFAFWNGKQNIPILFYRSFLVGLV